MSESAPRRSGIYWAISDVLVLAGRNLRHIPRVPDLLMFATIQPVMFVLLFRYVFGGAINVTGTSYVNFLMAGIFVQTVAFGSTTTGMGLAQDMQKGLIDRFRSLPMSRASVLVGRTLADLVMNVFVVFVMLIVGLVVGFRPQGSVIQLASATGLLILVSFSFSWISALLGLSVSAPEAFQSAGFIWLFPLTFASSAFVETKTMPGWLKAFAENQPFTHFVDTTRALLLDRPVGEDGWQALAWCLGILIVFVPLAVARYRSTSR